MNFFRKALLGDSFDELNCSMRAHDVLDESVITFLYILRLNLEVRYTLSLLWVFK